MGDTIHGTLFSAPTTINLEITDKCNANCRHCYNFWRPDHQRTTSMTCRQIDTLVEMMANSGVFHVVLSGGEPFSNFRVLVHACERLQGSGISISVNSNLMTATPQRLERLRRAGVDHILTSLNSFDPVINDALVQVKGAHGRIVAGITAARKAGIRVSANMILNRENMDQVYETALLAHRLGCQKIFATRVVPPVNPPKGLDQQVFRLHPEQIRHSLDQLIAARDETGIMIGSLVGYPLCFLKDLVKYSDFVGRGCPAQAGHRMSINADGTAHCCVHEAKGYGNVFEIGIAAAYRKMHTWHKAGFRHSACRKCPWEKLCLSGCRMSALGHNGSMTAADPLMGSPAEIKPGPQQLAKAIGMVQKKSWPEFDLSVSPGLRFRPENGFWLVNIRWANTIRVQRRVGEFLQRHCRGDRTFKATELGLPEPSVAWELLYKGVLQSPAFNLPGRQAMAGLSLDPAALPKQAMEAA